MKDFAKDEYEAYRPHTKSGLELIDFCLELLYADIKHQGVNCLTKSKAGTGLTYEELIGTLLVARDELVERNELLVMNDD